MQEVIIWQHGRKPRPLTEVVPGLPDRVWTMVAKALEKDRERRYRDNGELQVALQATLRWLEARGLLPAERVSRPHDFGDPARSIVHVERPGERVPSNLPYVSTREESPSLRNPQGAQVRVEHAPGHGRPTPVPPHGKGLHGTQILEDPVVRAPAVWGPPPPSVAPPSPVPATQLARRESPPRAPAAVEADAEPELEGPLAGMPIWLAVMLLVSAATCVAITVYSIWVK
jgi:hypothetical protein